MSLFLLAIFSLLFIYVWWGEETRDDPDPGYGTEHMGAHMVLGFLGIFIVVDLIYIAFTDIISFLVALTTMAFVGFVGFFVFGEERPEVAAKLAHSKTRKELEQILEAGPQSQESYEDYRDSISDCLVEDGCGNLLQDLPDDLKANREIVGAAICGPDTELVPGNCCWEAVPVNSPLKHAADELKQDRSLILEAMAHCADAYELAPDDLKKDPDFYLAALAADLDQRQGEESNSESYHLNARWDPPFESAFYHSALGFYEYLVKLDNAANLLTVTGCGGPNEDWLHDIDARYGEHLPRMFTDWQVICRALTDEWCCGEETLRSPLLQHLPGSLISDGDSDDDQRRVITSREFILFAIKEGYPDVLVHASDALQNDEEIKRLVSENTKGSESS